MRPAAAEINSDRRASCFFSRMGSIPVEETQLCVSSFSRGGPIQFEKALNQETDFRWDVSIRCEEKAVVTLLRWDPCMRRRGFGIEPALQEWLRTSFEDCIEPSVTRCLGVPWR